MKQFNILFRQLQVTRVATLLGLCLLLINSAHSSPFTYQGRLSDGAEVPSAAQYEMTFQLRDAETAGNQVGPLLTFAPVSTINGVFTVVLDFGAGVFNGSARWLQIAVRVNGSEPPLQVLTPRQAVTFTPQAIYAQTVADGAITPEKISGVIKTENIPNLDAGKIISGTFADARLSLNIGRLDGANAWTQNNFFLGSVAVAGPMSVGSLTAAGQLAVNGPLAVAGVISAPSGVVGTFEGDGSGLTDVTVSAANIVGSLSANQISTAIARSSEVAAAETKISALEAQISELSDALATITGMPEVSVMSGATFVSADPADSSYLASGLRNVATIAPPAWVSGSTTDQPSARVGQSAVWTGQEMIVWGGTVASFYSSAGGAYRPDIDAWTTVSTVGAPLARSAHSAIWTGSQMIVWGGFSGTQYLDTGGQFSIANQTWSAVSNTGAPEARDSHVATWTGSRMVVWGGSNVEGLLSDGGTYDPVNNSWTTISLTGAPVARAGASSVWANDRLLVWGGDGNDGLLNSGAQLRFSDDVPSEWQATSLENSPTVRSKHTAIWTGTKMIIWGGFGSAGFLGDGASYDPATDSWTSLSLVNAPTARSSHSAVWTGSEMIVLGGETAAGATATGGAYDPVLDKWRVLSNPGSPVARYEASAVWIGSEVVTFGGRGSVASLASLQRLTPQPAWYFYRKP